MSYLTYICYRLECFSTDQLNPNVFLCYLTLTNAHTNPSVVDTIVAALGVLYMSASSPKLPELSYAPTLLSFTKMSNLPLQI